MDGIRERVVSGFVALGMSRDDAETCEQALFRTVAPNIRDGRNESLLAMLTPYGPLDVYLSGAVDRALSIVGDDPAAPDPVKVKGAREALESLLDLETVLQREEQMQRKTPCRFCRAVGTVSVFMRQTRSGDEGMLAYAECSKCGRSWKE